MSQQTFSQLHGMARGVPDTRPISLGGVSSTGKSKSFFCGGYAGAGAVGAMPYGTPPTLLLPTAPMPVTKQGRNLLGTPPTAANLGEESRTLEEPSPKSADGMKAAVLKDALNAAGT